MYLIFDTETTGLPKNWNAPISDSDNWPRMVQISWQIHDSKGDLIEVKNYIIKPEGYEIPYAVVKVHGITTERANKTGIDLSFVLTEFNAALEKTKFVVGHNIGFDNNIIGAEFIRKNIDTTLSTFDTIDTKDDSTNYCELPGGRGGGYKWPKLEELHEKLFGVKFDAAHNAAADVEATARCFFELIRLKVIAGNKLKISDTELKGFFENNKSQVQAIGLDTQPYSPDDLSETTEAEVVVKEIQEEKPKVKTSNELIPFSHLHLHTQYSILDGAADINDIAAKAKADNMEAVAITDHGNMFGVKLFHKTLNKAGVKPILGCEVYVAKRGMSKKESSEDKSGHHLILLAKNEEGYKNLTKLISYSWLEGFYYKPRIDKEILQNHAEGLIALSACLGGEVPQKIMNYGVEAAEEAALWYKELFGDDYYLEMQRHRSLDPEMNKKIYDDQVFVNTEIIKLAKKNNIKLIATNDVHYVEEKDSEVQDRLLCVSTGKYLSDEKRMRYTGQEWMKTQAEMNKLFADIPEALVNNKEVIDKIENYELNKNAIMPEFEIPTEFGTEEEYKQKFTEEILIKEFGEKRFHDLGGYDKVLRIKFESDYLAQITYEGADFRWDSDINEERKKRLDFELTVIKEMGFPGYFLIVWDFLKAARDMGVVVGPGRGSAAGSAVAYSLRITEIDPIEYNLLFERFLNPDRISMPDIDIDFDDDGRAKVLKWVVDKYGKKRVAHIITFGSMAAKSAIRDVGRVQEYSLQDTMTLQKLVPDKPGTTLNDAFKEVHELADIRKENSEASEVLKYALQLEGSVRNTGTHACGIIIGKDDLENYVPISTAKDSELTYVTQYDGKHVEDIGLLKMDFLGLKTLSIIKDAVENVKLSKDIDIDIEKIDLTDEKTYQLYARGETTGLFQFESDGMKKHLKDLKPTRFGDLIAMNALYRPGPMEYIPSFVKRKNGKEEIEYDVPMMDEYLEETYGITVYQEQVMLLSRKLAGFTRGESDSLRKAMGKKIIAMMNELKVKFVDGCNNNEKFISECEQNKKKPEEVIEKIWGDWEAFAKYAFNKSHATCYSFVSFQTAYLKAHYPAEFMAAVLSRNQSDIEKVTFFMGECKRIGLNVFGPDVNESYNRFTVNKKGDIRFGLEAIKGVGGAAVESIIEERKNGEFKSIFDFIERIKLTSVNKKTIESLAFAGAFDNFDELERYQFFDENATASENSFLMNLISYGNKFQSDRNSGPNLFGDTFDNQIERPAIENNEEWSVLQKLKLEKDVIGVYLSAHPLDPFKIEIDALGVNQLSELAELDKLEGRDLKFVGFITESTERTTKTNKQYGRVLFEDFTGSYEHMFFSTQWAQRSGFLKVGYPVIIYGTVKKNKWRDDELQFEVTKVELLADAKDKVISGISLKIEIESLTDEFISELKNKLEEHKGPAELKVLVFEKESKIWIELYSKSIKVDINDEFLNFLRNIPAVEFKINS